MSGEPPTSSPPPGAAPLWGSHTGHGAPAALSQSSRYTRGNRLAAGASELEPLSRRCLRAAGALSLLLVLVVVNSLLHSGDASPFSPNPVAAAAQRAEKIEGGRFSMYVVFSSPATPRSITATGSGAFDAKTGRNRATMDMSVPGVGTIHIVEITAGDSQYVKGDPSASLPPGKEWVRTDKNSSQSEQSPLDMEQALGMLGSSGEVRLVGRESIDGTTTRRYRSETPLAAFVEYLREHGDDKIADAYEEIEATSPTGVSAETWIDRKNLPRRFRMVMPMPGGPGRPPLTVDMRMDIFDYGHQPAIQVPDPDSVVDGPLDEGAAPTSASLS